MRSLELTRDGSFDPTRRFWLREYQRGDDKAFTPRADMASDLYAEGGVLPRGPRWTLCDTRGGGILGIGGLEPSGASSSMGWFLTADMSPRQWAGALDAVRDRLRWARQHAIRRIYALTPGDRPEAAAMLARLGFKLTGQDGGDAIMTLNLTEKT